MSAPQDRSPPETPQSTRTAADEDSHSQPKASSSQQNRPASRLGRSIHQVGFGNTGYGSLNGVAGYDEGVPADSDRDQSVSSTQRNLSDVETPISRASSKSRLGKESVTEWVAIEQESPRNPAWTPEGAIDSTSMARLDTLSMRVAHFGGESPSGGGYEQEIADEDLRGPPSPDQQ